jgi:hypothetical protein
MGVGDMAEGTLAAQTETFERTAERVRELNERLLRSAIEAGSKTLDAYERALRTLVVAGEDGAAATPFGWLTALAQAQADFVRDVSLAHAAALRVLLD